MPLVDESALDRRIREIAEQVAARPVFVTQRNVESICGLPRRDYLRLARANAWPTTRERRLVVSRTTDVLAYVEQRIGLRERVPSNDCDAEAIQFSKVGARRVAK